MSDIPPGTQNQCAAAGGGNPVTSCDVITGGTADAGTALVTWTVGAFNEATVEITDSVIHNALRGVGAADFAATVAAFDQIEEAGQLGYFDIGSGLNISAENFRYEATWDSVSESGSIDYWVDTNGDLPTWAPQPVPSVPDSGDTLLSVVTPDGVFTPIAVETTFTLFTVTPTTEAVAAGAVHDACLASDVQTLTEAVEGLAAVVDTIASTQQNQIAAQLLAEAASPASPELDAFNRLRVSNPETLFDSKQLSDQTQFFDNAEVSATANFTYDQDRASTTLSVPAATAGNGVRQSFMRFNYQPGKSHLIFMTGILDLTGGGTGITQQFGYFDDDNGIIWRNNEGALEFVVRSSASGAPVETVAAQTDWNLDPFDGTGPSGVTLDPSLTQILIIDFEWLAVGRVRVGFVIDGLIQYAHEFNHANTLGVVYMNNPNLPVRYEIESVGGNAAAALESICATVMAEGGVTSTGLDQSVNMGTTEMNADVAGTTYAMLGIRLRSDRLFETVNVRELDVFAANNDDFLWSLRFNPTVAGVFTFSDYAQSALQTAQGDTPNTVTGGEIIASGYGEGNSRIESLVTDFRRLGAAVDGTRDEIVLCVTPFTPSLNVYGEIGWQEAR